MKILLLFFLIPFAHAAPFDSWNCKAQVSKLTNEWKSRDEWTKQNIGGVNLDFFASPTDVVGRWILVRKTTKGIAVARANETGRFEARFEDSTCKPKIKVVSHKPILNNFFSDTDLAAFVKKNRTGLIYVWSPRMNLSQNGLKEIQEAAKKRNLSLLILLAKDVSDQEQTKLKNELGTEVTKRVDSFELKMRNIDLHYPALLTFKNGLLNSRAKYGFEKTAGYLRDIDMLWGK